MEYRILGKTGLKISRMGFGGIPIQRIDAAGTAQLMRWLSEKGGPKTAAWLIREFGCLASIIDRAEEITKPSIRASIQQNAERLRINDQLIRLTGDVKIPFEAEKLSYQYDGVTTTQVLAAIGLR